MACVEPPNRQTPYVNWARLLRRGGDARDRESVSGQSRVARSQCDLLLSLPRVFLCASEPLRIIHPSTPPQSRSLYIYIYTYVYIYIHLVCHGNRQDVFYGFRRRYHPTSFCLMVFVAGLFYGFRRRRKRCLWFPSLVFFLWFPSWQENDFFCLWFLSLDFWWILPPQEDPTF